MTRPQPGQTYRLADPAGLGAGPDALPTGCQVTVRELVPAGVQGAHTDTEDSVVVEWQQPEVGYTDGQPVITHRARATAVGAAAFADLFEEAG